MSMFNRSQKNPPALLNQKVPFAKGLLGYLVYVALVSLIATVLFSLLQDRGEFSTAGYSATMIFDDVVTDTFLQIFPVFIALALLIWVPFSITVLLMQFIRATSVVAYLACLLFLGLICCIIVSCIPNYGFNVNEDVQTGSVTALV